VVRVSHTSKRPTSRKSAMVSRSMANPSIQRTMGPPGGERFGGMARLTRPINIGTNGMVGSLSMMRVNRHRRPEATCPYVAYGASKTIHRRGYAFRAGSQVTRITEGHLQLTEKLLCEQRRNLLRLPAQGRWTGHQCHNRDSGPVVVGGGTPTQGAGERPAQGEGVSIFRAFKHLTDSTMLS
jgi:hypothetical protein